MKQLVPVFFAITGTALLTGAAFAQPAFHTAVYETVPSGLPVAVFGPDRSSDDIRLAERIRELLRERKFAVVEDEAEDGLLLSFSTECNVPPVVRPKAGVDVGVVATEHGVTADIDVDARIVAPLQGSAASPPPAPSLRVTMRLTGTGQRPRLYWTGEANEPLGRKCSVELAPSLAVRLLDDLATRRSAPEEPEG